MGTTREVIRINSHPATVTSIVINGDVCTGSSTLARELASMASMTYWDVGLFIRRSTRLFGCKPDEWESLVSVMGDEIWKKTVRHIQKPRHVVEGRLVGLQARDMPKVLKILCKADEEVVLERFVRRALDRNEKLPNPELSLAARREKDERTLQSGWGQSRETLLRPELFDFVIDTSETMPHLISSMIIGMVSITPPDFPPD